MVNLSISGESFRTNYANQEGQGIKGTGIIRIASASPERRAPQRVGKNTRLDLKNSLWNDSSFYEAWLNSTLVDEFIAIV